MIKWAEYWFKQPQQSDRSAQGLVDQTCIQWAFCWSTKAGPNLSDSLLKCREELVLYGDISFTEETEIHL